jgi:hypothetical protein
MIPAEGSQVQGQPGLRSEILFQKSKSQKDQKANVRDRFAEVKRG